MNTFHCRLLVGLCGIIGFGVGFTHSYRPSTAGSPVAIRGSLATTLRENAHLFSSGATAAFEPLPVDPIVALQHASLYVSCLHRRYEVAKVAATLNSKEMRRLLESLWTKEEYDIRVLLLQLWTEKDPAAAAAYAAALPAEGLNYYLGAVFQAWARRDVAAAFTGSLRLPAVSRLCALNELAGSYFSAGKADPATLIQAAMAAAKEASDNPRTSGYLPQIFRQWAMNDSAAAFAFAKNLPDPKERDSRLSDVLEGWAERSPKEAMRHFGEITFAEASTQDMAVQSMAERLAEKDVTLAAEFAQGQPEGLMRARAVGAVANQLLSTDRDAALALVATVPVADSYGLVYSFYESWAESDPVAALRHCSERLDAMEPGTRAREDLASMLENNFLTTAMEHDPRGTAEFLAGQAESRHPDLLASLLQRWSYRDSAAAVAWADSLPDSLARGYAFAGLAEGRARQSLHETVEWLRALPKDSTYPAAVQGFASGVFSQDPDGALAWLRTIADRSEQQHRMQSAWMKWASSDLNAETRNRTAAEHWRDSSPDLSEQERRSLHIPPKKQE